MCRRRACKRAPFSHARRELEEEEKERRLDAIRAQVAVEATADPVRLMAPTESSRAEALQAQSGPRVNGYMTDDLMRDPRFRLMTALHERGLTAGRAGSYAADVVGRTAPLKPTRVDNLTSHQIQRYEHTGRLV